MIITLKTKISLRTNIPAVIGNTLGILLLYVVCLGLNAQEPKLIHKGTKLYFNEGEQGGWVPFRTAAKPGNPSVLVDLTQAMQEYSGIQFIPIKLPSKRAQKALNDGLIDFNFISLGWLKGGQPSEDFLTTIPLFEITEHLVTLKKNTHLFPTRESMFGKHVGTIAGYLYFDDNKFIRTDFLNENQLMKGLKYDRFKVIILERETAKYWAKLNDIKIGFAALHTSGYIVMVIRKKHQRLMPLLNQTIKAIKSSGKLKAILQSHGVGSQID